MTTSRNDCRRIVEDMREDFAAAARLAEVLDDYERSGVWACDEQEAEQIEKDFARFEFHPEINGLEITFDFDEAVDAINERFDPLQFTVLTDGRGRFCARILFGSGGPFYGVEKDAFAFMWRFFCYWGGEHYEDADYDGLIEARFADAVRCECERIESGHARD